MTLSPGSPLPPFGPTGPVTGPTSMSSPVVRVRINLPSRTVARSTPTPSRPEAPSRPSLPGLSASADIWSISFWNDSVSTEFRALRA